MYTVKSVTWFVVMPACSGVLHYNIYIGMLSQVHSDFWFVIFIWLHGTFIST